MRYFYLIFLLILGACKAVIQQPMDIEQSVAYLSSDELFGRKPGTEGIEKAAIFLENQLKNSHIKPYFKSYRDTLSDNKEYYNIVGEIKGRNSKLKKEYVVLGAHYDHLGYFNFSDNKDGIYNGANDNASGVAVISEIARKIALDKKNKRSVLVVFFTAEEMGLLGSEHLAKKLKATGVNVVMMLNIDMIGVPMQNDYKVFITGDSKSNMGEKLNSYVSTPFIEEGGKGDMFFSMSDNFPFYVEFNIPAHTISSFYFSNYKYYHNVKDEFKELNIPFMKDVTNDLYIAISKMINANDIKIN